MSKRTIVKRDRIRGAEKRKRIYTGVAGILSRAVDATLGIFAPRTVHAMRVARVKSSALVAYEAAEITRTNPAAPTGSADGEILPDLHRLRDLSRTLVRDDANASSTVDILDDNIVGDGIVAQSTCTPEETGMSPDQCAEWRAFCDQRFRRWCDEEADATRVGTFYDLQSIALRSFLTDGDGIGHLVAVGDGVIACELVDADRVESPGFYDTDKIRAGVELGPNGERIAFWILPSHPDDVFPGSKLSTNPIRIATEDRGFSIVQHVFKRTRPGQTRGVPLLTPSLLYSRHLHHYLDSEMIAARAASNFAMFIKRTASVQDPDIFPVRGNEQATEREFHQELEPGIIEYLNEGEEPVEFAPNRPGTAFDPFVMRMLRSIAASTGLSYEIVARDFGRMNLSSARAMLRECRRGFDRMRKRFVRQFCRPWYHNVIRAEVGAGRLKPPAQWLDRTEAFLAHRWVAPSYGMVDPKTDVEASVAAVAANLSDPYEEAAKQGRDAEQTLENRARFLVKAAEIEKRDGLKEGVLTAQPNAPSPPAQSDPDNANEPKDEEVPA